MQGVSALSKTNWHSQLEAQVGNYGLMKNVFEVINKVLSHGSETKWMGDGRSAEHI